MQKILIAILLTTSLFSREYLTIIDFDENSITNEEGKEKKETINYWSIGFLDHRTGNSLVGYARIIMSFEKHEIFIGVGTLIAANTLSVGWKYYLLDSPMQLYSVLSTQAVAGMGGGFVSPFVSLGIEKSITKKLFFNLGLNTTIRIYSHRPIELVAFPNININFRY